jgi:DNA repair protein RecO (recombination protein O)
VSRRSGTNVAEGLVLRRHDFSETSQILRLYTREFGRLSVLGKGLKRGGPELRGPADLLDLAEVEVRLRRDSDLHLIVRYVPIYGYPGLRRRLERLGTGLHVAEILREGTRDLDPEPALFGAADTVLRHLESASPHATASLAAWFGLRFLDLFGAEPEWNACVRCGREAPPVSAVRLSLHRGGLLCRACLAGRPEDTILVPAVLRSRLLELRASPAGAAARPATGDRELGALIRRVLEWTLERELPAAAFVGEGLPLLPGGRRLPSPAPDPAPSG